MRLALFFLHIPISVSPPPDGALLGRRARAVAAAARGARDRRVGRRHRLRAVRAAARP